MAEGEGTSDGSLDSAYVSDALVSSRGGKNFMANARRYQLELCKIAVEKNIIVYLETGCGKTLIAILVMYELRGLVSVPQRRVCIFLAPTVALVHQQANVIKENLDFKIAIRCGTKRNLNTLIAWETEIEQHEALIMTPQTLLHYLSHGFIKMEYIALLVLDECHHAQINSNHPYAEIMRIFYGNPSGKFPRIFGMTASPIIGKGYSSAEAMSTSINSLEHLLNATVYTVDKQEIETIASFPEVVVYLYKFPKGETSSFESVSCILEEIKLACLIEVQKRSNDPSLNSAKKLLLKLHGNIIYCMEQLGICGASQACRFLLDDTGWNDQTINLHKVIYDEYLSKVAKIAFDSVASHESYDECLEEPFFSSKILCLIELLSASRFASEMKCIIFVNRITIARCLSHILRSLRSLASWRCEFLVGIHSGLKGTSRNSMKNILENFHNGKVNLLVATKAGEEGLDIQTCCLVVRFDLPDTLASFIQSRGRARMRTSTYAFLVNSANKKELDLIERFKRSEDRMNVEVRDRTSENIFPSPVDRVFEISTSGAAVTSGYSISLLHHYCSKLPHDEFFDPKPNFYYFDDMGKTVCRVILPSSAPFHEIDSAPQFSNVAAKRDACLNAVEKLHKLGALNSHLLPFSREAATNKFHLEQQEPAANVVHHLDGVEDETTTGGLYEILVPSVLKPLYPIESPVSMYCYYLDFYATPDDRNYKKFGLLLLAPLPQKLEGIDIELHLDRGRSVITKLVLHGLSVLNSEEIMLLKNFQEMYLRVVLDPTDFTSEYVKLGKDVPSSDSRFYFVSPVNHRSCPNKSFIDWDTIRTSLSSPIFRNLISEADQKECSPQLLYLANGSMHVKSIQNSLVYVPHLQRFFFIISTAPGRNAYSLLKFSTSENHVEHYSSLGIHVKYPTQTLLLAKQLFRVRNLLHKRESTVAVLQEKEEHFVELVPELCELKIKAFSKEIGSTASLIPSIMHRLEGLLVASELRCLLSSSFPEGNQVTTERVLEALTTEICQECFSLERLEVLGDSFLKFVVSRKLFLSNALFDPGYLTEARSNIIGNKNLLKVSLKRNLQVYIRDQPFDPSQTLSICRPCDCTNINDICNSKTNLKAMQSSATEIRCNKAHHFLYNKTISDSFEALVGAFLVDSGFKAALAFLDWMDIKVAYEANKVVNILRSSSDYMILSAYNNIPELEKSLGYTFIHKGLLIEAFIHPSFNKHRGGCYQRLEYLGDAVLDYVITSYLFSAYPELKPGHLTELRSSLVNNRVFANLAIDKLFHKFIICDSDDLFKAIRKYVNFVHRMSTLKPEQCEEPKYPKALGDLLESCMGAVYLDSGTNLLTLWDIVLSLWDPMLKFSKIMVNPVKELHEICQRHKMHLDVRQERVGRDFNVKVNAQLNDSDVCFSATACNSTVREAQRIASESLLTRLKDEGYHSKFNLEEFLKSCQKMTPTLIGYDECPIDSSSIEILNRSFETKSVPIQISDAHTPYSAKSRLFDICSSNHWKPPLFEQCHVNETSNLNLVMWKVIIQMESVVLECFGEPRSSQDSAVEHAAEGAIWYLQNQNIVR